MLTVVIYDTKFGNTEKVAQAIARGASTVATVRVIDTAEAVRSLADRPDLVLIGGPTQGRGLSKTLRGFFDVLPQSLKGLPAASFDTRYRGASWLMGSAAAEAAKRLGKAGGRLVAPPESFFISRAERRMELQGLEEGELERAERWGRTVGAMAGGAAKA